MSLFFSFGCVLLFGAAASSSATSATSSPNIVILFVDDMGANQVNVPIAREKHGFYSYTGEGGLISTPNIAQLAAEGMVFQTWYSGFQVRPSKRYCTVPPRGIYILSTPVSNALNAKHPPSPPRLHC